MITIKIKITITDWVPCYKWCFVTHRVFNSWDLFASSFLIGLIFCTLLTILLLFCYQSLVFAFCSHSLLVHQSLISSLYIFLLYPTRSVLLSEFSTHCVLPSLLHAPGIFFPFCTTMFHSTHSIYLHIVLFHMIFSLFFFLSTFLPGVELNVRHGIQVNFIL